MRTLAKKEAKAQIESIVDMVSNLDNDNDAEREKALEAIQNDPLSVEVRSGWHSVGSTFLPDEFCILLCWGGPSCRIVGYLTENAQPDNPRLEYQDWGTEWTEYALTEEEQNALQTYCEQFYYDE